MDFLDILEELRKYSFKIYRKNGDIRFYYSILLCDNLLRTEFNYFLHCSSYEK